MAKQMSQAMIKAEPSTSLGVLGITGEVLKIPSSNWNLMVSIIVLVLLPFCLFALGADLALRPLMEDINFKIAIFYQEHPSYPKDREIMEGIEKSLRLLLCLKLVIFGLFCAVLFFSLVTIIYSSARTCTVKQLNLKEDLSRIGGIWKRPMITLFSISLFSVIFVVVILILIRVFDMIAEGVPLVLIRVVLVILGTLCYLYFDSLWMLWLMLSIVEEDYYGLMALVRAGEVIKGKRIQEFAFMLVFWFVSVCTYMSFASKRREMNEITETGIAIWITMICLLCLVKVFMFMVYTVFYVCKKNHGEKVEVEEGVH